jgi:hypothetical protein
MADLGMYVLTSLLGAGFLLNNRKQQREVKDNIIKTQNQEVVGTDIYNSRDYYKGKQIEEHLVNKNWEASKNPIETNIIPMYYNTLHIKQDAEKIPNTDYQEKLIYNVVKNLDPEAKKLMSSAIQDIDRSVKPDWGIVMDRPKVDRPASNPLDQIGGKLIRESGSELEDFTHANMVPFYKGTITQDTRSDNRAKEGKLELYTGQFKLNQQQKQECTPLFGPTKGFTHINGSQEQRDMSRYRPSNTGKKNNVTPVEQIRVGPGLNDGYTSLPSGGHHSTLRILPKTISQLRVDPVLETEGRINSGKALNSKRTMISQMYKNRPELLVENKNGERNFTTVGAVRGRTLRPHTILRDTNRKRSRAIYGSAQASQVKQRIAPSTQKSKRQNFCNTKYRNATSSVKQVNDYGKSGYRNRPNSRAITGLRTHLLAPKGPDKLTTRLSDQARKTRKQHYVHNNRVYGNFTTQKPSAAPSYNPKEWAAKTTIRETTENKHHKGIVAPITGALAPSYNPNEWAAKTTIRETTENKRHKGIVAPITGALAPSYNPNEWVAKTTIRETTENKRHKGIVAPITGALAPSYNPNDWVAKTTIRETTENKRHKGIVAPITGALAPSYNPNDWIAKKTIRETTECNSHKGIVAPITGQAAPAYNLLDWIPRTTVKETTENNKHIGNVGTSLRRKHIVYDPKDRARTTIRETTENNDHIGNVGSLQKKHIVYDPNDKARTTIRETTERTDYIGGATGRKKRKVGPQDTARTTIRETTERTDYIGGVSVGQSQSGKGYTTNKYDAKNTNRQFTSDNEYYAGANSKDPKSKSYDDAYNAQQNVNKEKIAKGRRPGGGGPRLGHQDINIDIKKMDDDRTNKYAAIKTTTLGNIYNPNAISLMSTTSEKNHLPQHDERLDVDILDAYKRNPLTQSLSSWA